MCTVRSFANVLENVDRNRSADTPRTRCHSSRSEPFRNCTYLLSDRGSESLISLASGPMNVSSLRLRRATARRQYSSICDSMISLNCEITVINVALGDSPGELRHVFLLPWIKRKRKGEMCHEDGHSACSTFLPYCVRVEHLPRRVVIEDSTQAPGGKPPPVTRQLQRLHPL